jgi:hypothetical protein
VTDCFPSFCLKDKIIRTYSTLKDVNFHLSNQSIMKRSLVRNVS